MGISRAFTSRLFTMMLPMLFILLVGTWGISKTAQDKSKKKVFSDEDLKVEKLDGKWGAQTVPDLTQAYDPTVPVFVKSLNTFYGKDKYLGLMKVSEVELENRSSRLAHLVQLRWVIVSVDNPEVVLLEGVMPSFEVQVEPYSIKRTDIPEIYLNKILKPLLKDGELNGHFRLVVGLNEIRFADDSVWRRLQPVSLLQTSYRSEPSRFRYLVPMLYSEPQSPDYLSSPSTTLSSGRIRPGLLASAFLYTPLQVTNPPCRENRVCDRDPVTLLHICAPLPGAFCDLDGCDSEGHCNCWTAVGPCATCPDNDGDGHTAARCGGGDCRDDDEAVYPGSPELCGDGKDNDCEDGADCQDPVCWRPEHCDSCPLACEPGDCPDWCLGAADHCQYPDNSGCPGGATRSGNCCYRPSPVLVDVRGDGFHLTSGAGGVSFDINGDGRAVEKLSWTSAGSDDAWLALDRDGDGRVGDGRELFGGFTPQPPPAAGGLRNGFRALAEFDRPQHGGNGDGVIDSRDAVFNSLRLWQDTNHNGISEAGELQRLASLDVARLHLRYKESRRVDEHGNLFRFRAKVDDARGARVGRWAWDVFLVAGP